MKNVILIGLLLLGSACFATTQSEDNWRVQNQVDTTITATIMPINITASAGISNRALRIYMSSRGAGTAGFYWDIAYGVTYTATGILGHYQPVSSTAILIGPFAAGTILLLQGAGATAYDVFTTFEWQKYGVSQ